MEQQIMKEISTSELLAETLKLKNEGYRLVAITSTYVKPAKPIGKPETEESTEVPAEESPVKDMELTYSFDKGQEFINLRLLTDTIEEVMSISVIYSYSFLYENEIKELFGVNIKDISVDFNDQLYQIPVKTPFHLKKEEK